MTKKGFTLIELLAVLVLLAIILAIAVPGITGIIRNSAKKAFQSDAKLVLKAIDYEKLVDTNFNAEIVDKNNISNLLNLSDENYKSVKIKVEGSIPIITIIGKGKWDGFIACGTYKNMSVVESTIDCSTDLMPPVITLLGDNPTSIFVGDPYVDAGATAIDDKEGDISDRTIKLVL